jgi:hypothetical protein
MAAKRARSKRKGRPRRRKRRQTEASARRHEVRAELSNFSLAKAKSALTLRIYSRGEKVGELELGRGSIFWWGRHRQKFKRIGWVRFTEMMDQLAYDD